MKIPTTQAKTEPTTQVKVEEKVTEQTENTTEETTAEVTTEVTTTQATTTEVTTTETTTEATTEVTTTEVTTTEVTTQVTTTEAATTQATTEAIYLKFSQTQYDVYLDEPQQLEIDTNATKAITYVSDKPSIVSVDENGIVTARGQGYAVITATVAGKSASCMVLTHILEIKVLSSYGSISEFRFTVTNHSNQKIMMSPSTSGVTTNGKTSLFLNYNKSMAAESIAAGETKTISATTYFNGKINYDASSDILLAFTYAGKDYAVLGTSSAGEFIWFESATK